MLKLEVFDPPMCCSTGVCGPEVDPKLARFAGDLEWLKRNNVDVVRYNMAQQPKAFVDSIPVKQELDARGNSCLPLILANGRVLASGFYPQRGDLQSALAAFGVAFETPLDTEQEEGDESCCESEEDCCG
ncbi:arsenite efflux transporter metallochaperone ArsD [Bdellovibrionota bacterium FG-1]